MSMIREAFKNDHTKGKWVIGAVVLALGVSVAVLVYIAYSILSLNDSVRRVDALNYPVPQSVNNRLSGVGYAGAALRLGDPILVTGTKCSDAATPIVTFGVTTQSVLAPIRLNSTGEIAANLRQPGCTTAAYSNALDPAVVNRLREMFRNGTPYVVMKITGFESPVDQHYSSVDWFTEDFRVYPATGPGPGCCAVSPSSQASTKENS